ncbi:MAG: GAF domain-containing protein, partial [Syntrophomonas sp.]
MKSKQLVLTGFVITSLLAVLAASDIIPPLFMSFIVLAGGITATFFIALSQKRAERLADLSLMLKASQEINSHTEESRVFDELLYWLKRVIKCEAVLLYLDGKLQPDGGIAGQQDWEEFLHWIGEKPEPFLFSRTEKVPAAVTMPEQIQSLLAVPLRVNGDILAQVLLINEQYRGCFNEQDREFVQYLARQASAAW